jgi:hypothetical protein
MAPPGLTKRRIARCTKAAVALAAIVAAGWAILYLWYSRQNPKVLEVVGGSILITLLLGSATTLFSRLHGESKDYRGILFWLLTSISLLAIVIAFLVYESNTPRDIAEEIPVVYLIDPATNRLADLRFLEDETGNICYLQARLALTRLKEKEPKVNTAINSINTRASSPNDVAVVGRNMLLLDRVFQDLTEYLLIYGLGHIFFAASDGESRMYGGHALRWIARPEGDIGDEPQTLSSIEEKFKANRFYGITTTMDSEDPWQFHLPKGSHMHLKRNAGSRTSVLTIECNGFIRIDIAVQYLSNSSQGYVYLRELEQGVEIRDSQEPYRMLRRFHACIHYDVKFDRWRYGYAPMRHYENWANDLLGVLQRQLSWGNPPLANYGNVMRYYELRNKAQRSNLKAAE